jgi:multisubunit Na+/H+ antiporter MnhB subunit
MRSELLKIAALHLKPLFLLLSVIAFLRGHNEPGGGFVGGLLAGSAYVLYGMAFGAGAAKRLRFVKPFSLIATGLMLALISGLTAPLMGKGSFLEGVWISLHLFGGYGLKIGTPLLFDAGVYLLVAGMIMLVMLSVMEED